MNLPSQNCALAFLVLLAGAGIRPLQWSPIVQRQIPVTLLAATILAFVGPRFAAADQISIGATLDNSIFSESNNSDGASYDLYTGRTNQFGGATRRSLIEFDLAGVVPTGAVINSVSLTMRMSGGSPSGIGSGDPNYPQGYTGPLDVSLYRVLTDWGAGTSGAGMGNGGTSMAGAGGASPGFAPTPGDATWNYALWNTVSWATPGGDYVATSSATQAVNIIPQFVTWSSQGLVNDVQGWVNDSTTNFGWEILGDESTNGTSRRFVSMDAPNTAYRPELTIDFTPVPEPSAISLAVIGGIAARLGGAAKTQSFQALKLAWSAAKKGASFSAAVFRPGGSSLPARTRIGGIGGQTLERPGTPGASEPHRIAGPAGVRPRRTGSTVGLFEL